VIDSRQTGALVVHFLRSGGSGGDRRRDAEERHMWIEAGALGGLVIHGTAEEWERFAPRLDDLYAELKHDVVPAAGNPTTGSVNVTLQEALAVMAVMEDEELIRSLIGFILGRPQPPPDPS
jgi:hypothetical protein